MQSEDCIVSQTLRRIIRNMSTPMQSEDCIVSQTMRRIISENYVKDIK
jgi:hypothetical protein